MKYADRYRTMFIGHLHTEGGRAATSPSTIDYANLINEAAESIRLVSGRLPREVFLSDAMKSAFRNAKKRNPDLDIEILTGPKTQEDSLRYYEDLGANVKKLKNWPIDHFAIIDDKHIRTEIPHSPGDPSCIQDIYYNYNFITTYKSLFHRIAQQAE